MKALHLNHNGFFEFCKGYGESKTIKFPFNFSRLPPAPPAVFLRIRKFLVLRARLEGARPRRGGVGVTTDAERTIWFRATTRSARGLFIKILRILFIQCSNIVQKTPPIYNFVRNGRIASSELTLKNGHFFWVSS